MIRTSFNRFLRDERGGVLLEFVLFLPFLVWTMIAIVVFWDVFRTINTAQKAAYSVSDLISRQEDNLSTDFIDGMQDVYNYLMLSQSENVDIRITSLYYDLATDQYRLIFSVSPDDKLTPYTEPQLQTLRDQIPILNDRDSVIIVESQVTYDPPFNTGIFNIATALGSNVFGNFIVTPPRFRSAICLQGPGCPVGI